MALQLIGAVGGAGPDEVPGTALRRTGECVMLRMAGHSFRDGGPMRHSLQLRGILFDGGGGTAALASPAVELRSGEGYEYTNHVHFTGCRLESYPGTAIALTGANTNKIYLTDCKLESLASNRPALTASNAVALHLAGVQITARGDPGATLDSLLSIQDSAFIVGDLILEHVAWDGAATLEAYISLTMCRGVDLRISVIDGQDPLLLGSYVRIDGGEACSVRGMVRRGRHVEERSWTV